MLFGFGRTPQTEYMYNLKPFSTVRYFMRTYDLSTRTWSINLIGVFVPFGVLLPMIFKKSLSKIFIIFLGGLFVLESMQLLTRRGSFDIDDFILNSIGFLIGYLIYRVTDRIWNRIRRKGNNK